MSLKNRGCDRGDSPTETGPMSLRKWLAKGVHKRASQSLDTALRAAIEALELRMLLSATGSMTSPLMSVLHSGLSSHHSGQVGVPANQISPLDDPDSMEGDYSYEISGDASSSGIAQITGSGDDFTLTFDGGAIYDLSVTTVYPTGEDVDVQQENGDWSGAGGFGFATDTLTIAVEDDAGDIEEAVLVRDDDHLAFVQQPTDTSTDQAIDPPISVAIEDSAGNVVDGDDTDVTLSIAKGPDAAKLGGTATVESTNGIATFKDISLDTEGTYTLTASDEVDTEATSDSFDVGGDTLEFTDEPSNTPGGAPIDDVTVSIVDASDKVDTEAGDATVTIAVETGPTKTLSGTLTETTKDGVATFNDLSLGTAGTYTLRASGKDVQDDDTYDDVTSDSFTIGPVYLQGNFKDGESTGPVSIGLTPQAGASFVPLIRESDGSVSYDDTGLSASGSFSSAQVKLDLFTGTFDIDSAKTSTATMEVTSQLKMAGLTTKIESMTLSTDKSGSTANSYVALTGSLTLPDSIGGLTVALPDNPFTVGPLGLGLSTGEVQLPETDPFLFANALMVSVKDFSFSYTYSTDTLILKGDLLLSLKGGGTTESVDLNFGGSDNYIQISPTSSPPVTVKGSETYSNTAGIPLFLGWFSLTGLSVQIDSAAGSASGLFSIRDAGGTTYTGSAGFLSHELDSIGLQFTNLNIPVDPPLYLQDLGAKLSGLSGLNPNGLDINGNFGVGYGKGVRATFTGDLQLTNDGTLKSVSAMAALNIGSGALTGSATLSANFQSHVFGLTSLTLKGLGGAVSVSGSLTSTPGSNGAIDGSLAGTVTVPKSWPFFGGISAAGAVRIHIDASPDFSKSYVEGWAQWGKDIAVGAQYDFDGDFHLLGATQIPKAPGAALVPLASPAPVSQAFTVPSGIADVVFTTRWADSVTTAPAFQIVAPGGTVYTNTSLGKSGAQIIASLSDSTSLSIGIPSPAAGVWKFTVDPTTAMGTTSLAGFEPDPTSKIAVTSPASNVSGGSVAIKYTATDTNPGASVSLYYGPVGASYQGTLIADGLPVGSQSYTWNTSSAPTGTYAIFAVVTDSTAFPASAYAGGQVTVPAHLAFAIQPAATTTAGKAIAPAIVVDVQNVDGTVITSDNSTVTLAVKTGGQAFTITAQAKNGVATFSNDVILKIAGNYTLIATDGIDPSAVSQQFAITPAAAAKVVFSSVPTTVVHNTAFTSKVSIEDTYGNIVTATSSKVTLSLASEPTGGALTGTTTVAAVNGLVTFSTLKLNKAGKYTLKAVDGSLVSAVSSSIAVT